MTTSIGRYRVGIEFNPSGDEKVIRLKEKAAAFIDECAAQRSDAYRYDELTDEQREERLALYDRAMREAEGAAMWAVKAATKRNRT